ncbi:hypothetical protein Y032_0098g3108 [Ancylostoma ceylanicum]|uniref:Uncharacterized protein n=1 Tax=Ancylostoma ceylanicum TaxID=53326 RepID=A0A016TJ62_9BILA|nr:hypothetical protein Y032_0098g3108 [Ancylostoma ceylanicum]
MVDNDKPEIAKRGRARPLGRLQFDQKRTRRYRRPEAAQISQLDRAAYPVLCERNMGIDKNYGNPASFNSDFTRTSYVWAVPGSTARAPSAQLRC